jgi:hypothetical protein
MYKHSPGNIDNLGTDRHKTALSKAKAAEQARTYTVPLLLLLLLLLAAVSKHSASRC